MSSDDSGRVITLSPTGDLLNIYTGHPDINQKQTPFTPRGMTRTPSDNVIVCDFKTHALHLLNNTGVSLSYFSTIRVDIKRPLCVTFDSKDKDTLYIGCATPKGSIEKAKLYQTICVEME